MQESDREQFVLAVTGMIETFGKEASMPMLNGYWMALSDLSLEQVKRGIIGAMQTCKFLPTVADIRGGVTQSNEDEGLRAWSVFERAVSQYGGYKSVDFDDRRINAVVRHLGGWNRVCSLPSEEFDKWLRKDFLAAWEAFSRGTLDENDSAPLIGLHDKENRAKPNVHLISCGLSNSSPRLESKRATTAVEVVEEAGLNLEMGVER